MSDTDSFIDEVSAEVRRDRFYGYARRYGWIAVVAVFAVVGGSAFVEWRASKDRAEAESLGDAMLAALDAETAQSRSAALGNVAATGEAEALRLLLLAGEQAQTDAKAAADTLQQVIAMEGLRPVYHDLAALRLTMIPDIQMLTDAKLAELEPLTAPGAPLRLTALEQMAYLHAERNERDQALSTLKGIFADAEASDRQKQRVAQMIVALGGDLAES